MEQVQSTPVTPSLCTLKGNSLITLHPVTPSQPRTPTLLTCVIDNSGSMASEAAIKTQEGGEAENFGFSTMDLVKHALSTIIQSLGENDYLSLISFSDLAEIVLPVIKMDESGRKKAENALKRIEPTNSTNLWAGLVQGLNTTQEFKKKCDRNFNSSLLLLTDGQPNIEPPRGHIPAFKKFIKENRGLPCVVNTFGFGYSLDSDLLVQLAKVGGGTFSFIPDGSFVGTIFINAISSILSNCASNITLGLDLDEIKVEDFSLIKNYNHRIKNGKLTLFLGSQSYEQTRNVVLPITYGVKEIINVYLKYDVPDGVSVERKIELKVNNNNDNKVDIHRLRCTVVNEILNAMSELEKTKNYKTAQDLIANLINNIQNSGVQNEKFVKDLLKDVQEQVSIAFSKEEFYRKWGRHYLPSLARAHLLELCNNFKDPGVQHYGGPTFNAIRDVLDEIFLKLPPPTPSVKHHGNYSSAPLGNMANFYNSSGVCFGGEAQVKLQNGKTVKIKNIKKDDLVQSGEYNYSKVICVMKTKIDKGETNLTNFANGLQLTPYHPVKIGDNFCFASEISNTITKASKCEAVYNFVLEENHCILMNGLQCLTLSHEIEKGVAKHNYFGTQKIVKDLKCIKGWEEGEVEVKEEWVKRGADGLVNSIKI